MIKEAENVCHQGAHTAKTARADHLAGNFPKEAFDEVEPGRGGWRKVQMKAGMTLKPGDDLGMSVSGVVVADDVNLKLGGDLPVSVLAVTMRWSSRCSSEVTSIGMAAGITPTMP